MERHDPLGGTSPCEESPTVAEPPKRPRSRKLPPLLREVDDVANDTLAFLYGGPEQQPGDYRRNLERAVTVRTEFISFCTAHTHFANWRQAWAAFMAESEHQRVQEPEPITTVPVQTPAVPRWKQRFYQIART